LRKCKPALLKLNRAAFALIIGFLFAACGHNESDRLTDEETDGAGGRYWLVTKQTTYSAAEGLSGSIETNYDWIAYSYSNEKNYKKEYEAVSNGSRSYYHYTRNGQRLSLTAETAAGTESSTTTYDSESGLILNSTTTNNKDANTEISYAVMLLNDADGVKTYKQYVKKYINNNIKQDASAQVYSEYKIQSGRTLEQKSFAADGMLVSITAYTMSDNAVIREKLGGYTLYNTSSSAYNTYNTVEVILDSDSALLLREKTFKNNALSSQTDYLYEKINFGSNSSGFFYTELNVITITAYRGKGGYVAIPAQIDGKPVTVIGREAFGHFNYNRSISSVTIPDSVSVIGEKAFSGCPLTDIIIGSGVKIIGDGAFSFCTALTGITIPDGVTLIGEKAFEGCRNINDIIIPNSVKTIGDKAFYNSGLTSVTIGKGVISIGRAFSGCTGIAAITIENGVTAIWDFAFSGCTGLTSVTIPNSVTVIGTAAFYGCSGLANITIPGSVVSVGNSAFDSCTGLKSVTFRGTIAPDKIYEWSFPGDLLVKYLAGGAGTYTRENGLSVIWTAKHL